MLPNRKKIPRYIILQYVGGVEPCLRKICYKCACESWMYWRNVVKSTEQIEEKFPKCAWSDFGITSISTSDHNRESFLEQKVFVCFYFWIHSHLNCSPFNLSWLLCEKCCLLVIAWWGLCVQPVITQGGGCHQHELESEFDLNHRCLLMISFPLLLSSNPELFGSTWESRRCPSRWP